MKSGTVFERYASVSGSSHLGARGKNRFYIVKRLLISDPRKEQGAESLVKDPKQVCPLVFIPSPSLEVGSVDKNRNETG